MLFYKCDCGSISKNNKYLRKKQHKKTKKHQTYLLNQVQVPVIQEPIIQEPIIQEPIIPVRIEYIIQDIPEEQPDPESYQTSLIDNRIQLEKFIQKNLKPKEFEKKENGEVFTSMNTINEMMDKLDMDYIKQHNRSIFSEKHFKWGDICGCGIGNFSISVYYRLMKGLEYQIPDPKYRKQHIIENMLYMAELNPNNVQTCRDIFNSHGSYHMNLYKGDALTFNPVDEWKINEFDVIIGNPPFNNGGIRSPMNRQKGTENKTMWPLFVEKALGLLKKDGYLAFIHPLSWLKSTYPIHNVILDRHIIWLNLWDAPMSIKTINAAIPISVYVLQNTKNRNDLTTEVVSNLNRMKINQTSFVSLNRGHTIPLCNFHIFEKLTSFINTHNCHLDYKIKVSKSTGDKMKLPANYSINDNYMVDTYRIKEGIMVKRGLVRHIDMDKRKLIVSSKTGFRGTYIDEGKLGITGRNNGYILGDNLELIQKLLTFKISTMINNVVKYHMQLRDDHVMKFIPDLRKLNINDITEDGLYEMIGLTQDEINEL
jgi:hypothetical protein